MSKPFPHYVAAGISLFVTQGDGELHLVNLVLQDCYERSLEDAVGEILEHMAADGLRPVSEKEMVLHATAIVKAKQEEAIATRLQGRASDPDVQRKFLTDYMGRQGGDA